MKRSIIIMVLALAGVFAQAQIGSLPYMQGFEGGLDQWTTMDLDGDGRNWAINSVTDYGYVHTGTKSVQSYSYVSGVGVVEPDNWLVSPILEVDDESVVVEFWYRARYSEGNPEHMSVCVLYGTDTADFADAETALEFTIEGDNVWRSRVVSLSAWAGQEVRVALRHHGEPGYGALLVDDITIKHAYEPVVELQGIGTAGVGAPMTYTASLVQGFVGDPAYLWTSTMAAAGSATMTDADEPSMHITYNAIGTDTLRVIVSNSYGSDTAEMVVMVADAVVELPYYTGFEADDDTGWLAYGGTNSWFVGEAASHEGGRSLYISNNNGVANQYTFGSFSQGQASYAARLLVLTDAGDYRIGFNWRCMGESTDYLRAFVAPASVTFEANVTNGISTNNTPAGWVSVDGGSRLYQQNTWQRQEAAVTLTEGAYWLVFVWRTDYSDGNNPPAAVDSVTVWRYDCTAPIGLVREAVSQNSITIGWTPAGVGSQWTVSVDGGAWQGPVSTPSFTATGLQPGSSHTFAVRTLCSDEDTSIAVSAEYTTQCDAVSAFPWYEDFSELDVLQCWDVADLDGDGNSWHRDDGAVRIGAVADSSNDWAITRPFAIPQNAEGLALHWDVATGNYLYGDATYEVRYSATGSYETADFAELLFSETHNGPWARRTVALGSLAGQTVSFAFRKVGTGTGELAIDNMSISIDTPKVAIVGADIVDLEQPALFRVLVREGSTADLDYTWSVGASADIEQDADSVSIIWHEAGGDTLRLVATNIYGADTALLVVTVRDLEPAAVPYATGFEVGDDCNWQRIRDGHNMWVIDTAASHGGERALYISADTGRTNTYADSLSTYAAAYRIVRIDEAGYYSMNYDWRAEGEDGGYQQNDYMRVFMMPAAQELIIGYYGQITATSLPAGCTALDGGSQLNHQSQWQTHNEVLDIADTGLYRLVFYWRNDGSVGNNPAAAVDNVSLHMVSCWPPIVDTAATANLDDVVSDSVIVRWYDNGVESWAVNVNGGATIVVTDTFYAVPTLEGGVPYEVTVRSICAEGDTSHPASLAFTTACRLVDVPYSQNFDNGEARCWTLIDYNSTSGQTAIAQPPLLGASLALRLKPGTAAQPVFAVSPEVSFAEVQKVSFKALGARVVSLNVGVMTDRQDTSTFTSLGIIDSMESYNEWTDYEVSFEGNSLAQGYVAIRAGVTAEDNYSVFLDDIVIDTAALVLQPVDTTVVDTTHPEPPVDTTSTDTTSIAIAQGLVVTLQPNPATAEVRVCTVGPATVSLVDMQGRLIGEWRTENGELLLGVGTLPRGTYFVRASGPSGTAVRKLLLR